MDNIDMHVHTSASDGIFSPTEIVRWSKKLGLKGISITDHDTVDGIEEAIEASKKYNDFVIIPGIEFSTLYNQIEIHILGYFIDYKNSEIVRITNNIKNYRLKRAKLIIEKLRKLNYDITLLEVYDKVKKGSIGRPHIARVLIDKGYVSSVQEAFEKLLQKGKAAYVERFKLTVDDAIKIIKRANGIPVLAHPGLIDEKINVESLIYKGIEGIEVYHTKHLPFHNKIYLRLARKHNIFVTGGSDYHDEIVNGVPAIGKVSISYDKIIKMKNK
ncbi:PHP domain-containing protein [Crassaminicella thermophila]|uniref:PHP domain-containing protein n=1 Tax=Crassaminicella thermophila TaxID=2599308 RepID=A0A5C0SD87_CRATE|nr:PHP domain-containing protein [Crassaminicella thermophila]QEK12211.1 PHP domain-containing protein [Crassaminicella thermophila]